MNMKKFFYVLLLLLISCGPSEDEIQERIDEAVVQAIATSSSTSSTTVTTTTTTTTTTTIDYLSFCRSNIRKIFDLKNLILDNALPSFLEVVRVYEESGGNPLDPDVSTKAFIFYGDVEEILDEQKLLPGPEVVGLYQDYWFAITNSISSLKLLAADTLIMTSTRNFYKSQDRLDYQLEIITSIYEWDSKLNEYPSCSATNY